MKTTTASVIILLGISMVSCTGNRYPRDTTDRVTPHLDKAMTAAQQGRASFLSAYPRDTLLYETYCHILVAPGSEENKAYLTYSIYAIQGEHDWFVLTFEGDALKLSIWSLERNGLKHLCEVSSDFISHCYRG
jgi:hypothetical protein